MHPPILNLDSVELEPLPEAWPSVHSNRRRSVSPRIPANTP